MIFLRKTAFLSRLSSRPNIRKAVIVVDHKCWHYNAIDKTDKVTCINCHHWGWTKCEDEALLKERQYEESKAFNAMDRMMRQNKGVRLD